MTRRDSSNLSIPPRPKKLRHTKSWFREKQRLINCIYHPPGCAGNLRLITFVDLHILKPNEYYNVWVCEKHVFEYQGAKF